MYLSDNRTSFNLWPNGSLLKRQIDSKYYENDGLQNCILLFISSLTTKLIKNIHIYADLSKISKKLSLNRSGES